MHATSNHAAILLVFLSGACAPSGTTSAPLPGASGGEVHADLTGSAPSGLSYATSRPVWNAGRPIPPDVPSVSGSGITFSVNPALPLGLVLDPTTGVISGTAVRVERTTRHVVTAANASGWTRVALFVTVLGLNQAIDPAHDGTASALHVTQLKFGRLVDVWGLAPGNLQPFLQARDVLVGEAINTAADYEVVKNIATQKTRITIMHPFGTPAYAAAWDQFESSLISITVQGPGDLPPFTEVGRDAAVAVQFDDLLDAASVTAATLKLFTGIPSVAPYEMRVRADSNHGGVLDVDGDGLLDFVPTRALLDFVVSPLDAASSSPPLAVNLLGLPEATTDTQSNILLRIPTQIDAGSGQFDLVKNLAGHVVAFAGDGPNDPASPTQDVVRAFRSGSANLGDLFNGYLRDVDAPRIIAQFPGQMTSIIPDPVGGRSGRIATFTFGSPACVLSVHRGDTFERGSSFLEVRDASVTPSGISLTAHVQLVDGPEPVPGAALLSAQYDATAHAALMGCFVRFDPPASSPPVDAVAADASIVLTFSEPINPRSAGAFDQVFVTRAPGSQSANELVVASLAADANARNIRLSPRVPLKHTIGTTETYYCSTGRDPNALTDLAGNPLAADLGPVGFHLRATDPTVNSGGVALRFDSLDMIPDGGGKPEFRGQFLWDLASEVFLPRPVTRFSGVADRTQPVPSVMTPFSSGVGTPISRYGSKLQSLWRYCDVGYALLDEQFTNVDVEHLWWAPVGGSTVADFIPHFEMSLAHAKFLPDEAINPVSLLPSFPGSGLVTTYAQNVLDPVHDPLQTVYPGPSGPTGYAINPIDAQLSTTNTVIMPWPLNRGVPIDQFVHYTWRDTALQARAGAGGAGAELEIVVNVQGFGTPGVPYASGQVPSIGLPLLTEFRCYPDNVILGLNSFDVSLAVASSAQPNSRAFSTGGVNTSGSVVIKNPDLELVASGGFDPHSIPPGAATMPADNTFYLGQMDLVTRISRVHSIWFNAGAATASVAEPVVEPRAADLPTGTALHLDFRGATGLGSSVLGTDATMLDAYGDPLSGPGPIFLANDSTWKSAVSALAGAHFVQTRITFISNAVTNLSPQISSLGIAWRLP